MQIVENTLETSVEAVLERPLFCFLSQLSTDGAPRISPFWYLWEDGYIWIIADREKTYSTRVDHHSRTALAIMDFDERTGRVHHVGMRGDATLTPLELSRANRLLERYLGAEKSEWDDRFIDLDTDRWQFIQFEPDTVVARDQSFEPGLEDTC